MSWGVPSVRHWRIVLFGAFAVAAVAGCAGKHIEHGIFYSPKGYRITIPGNGWMVTPDSQADLELRGLEGRVGMLINAVCDADTSRSSLPILERHLLAGLRDRSVATAEDVTLAGRPARHAVVDGRLRDEREALRVELYVMRDGRCVYDFLYAAPPASFGAARPEFERFVGTFRVE